MLTIDAAVALCEHLRDLELERQRDALEIDGQDAIPFLLVELGDRMCVGRDRGVVDRAVEPPVALDGRADHGPRVGGARDVRPAERRVAAVLSDARRRRLAETRR